MRDAWVSAQSNSPWQSHFAKNKNCVTDNLLPVPSRCSTSIFSQQDTDCCAYFFTTKLLFPSLHSVRCEISKVHLQSVSWVSFRRSPCKNVWIFVRISKKNGKEGETAKLKLSHCTSLFDSCLVLRSISYTVKKINCMLYFTSSCELVRQSLVGWVKVTQ